MTSQEKVDIITKAVDDLKAEQIELLDVRGKSSVTDYMIVCSGTSDRHVSSIADRAAEAMTIARSKPVRSDGENTGWIIQDYGDVILNVMRDEQRQFYDLETLWNSLQVSPDNPVNSD
ncbi:MAG: ribosome silencing factor [Armatimonadetes bacterium 55-13]|nr:ribosome silencing factor [Armatimonadota bacterium]OJU62408.1 MAG: ribosome silencing factor [Armatimonadetes bacterium 55-13]